jgi:outer membrane protein TolC
MPSRAPLCAWLAACAVVVPIFASAQERPAQEVVAAIVRDGPRASAIRADVEVVRREQQARLAFPNPGVSYSREGAGFTEFLQVEQPLPLFGVRLALVRAGVAATAAAEAERDARLWELRVDATRLVSRLQAAQLRAEAAAADIAAVDRLIGILRIREQEGEGSRFDRLRAEQELAEVKQAAVAADIDVSDTRGELAALLPAGVTVTRVTGPVYESHPPLAVDVLAARAQSTRAELRALRLSVDRAASEADAARRQRWPAPVLTGGLKRADNGNGRDRGGVFGVAVAVPLFDTGARDAARWTAEGARMAAERLAIEQQVSADITRAVDALTRRERALAATGTDRLATELVAIAEVAYREGEVAILALLDAVRTASRARMREIEMRLETRLAQIALERAVGEVLWP